MTKQIGTGTKLSVPRPWQACVAGANASATIDRFCSVLQRRRRSGLDSTSIWVIAPSLPDPETIRKGFRKKMDGLGFGLAGPQCLQVDSSAMRLLRSTYLYR
jgi:hypothetical protein